MQTLRNLGTNLLTILFLNLRSNKVHYPIVEGISMQLTILFFIHLFHIENLATMSMQEYFLLSLFEFYFYCQGGRGLVGGEAGASAPCTVSSDGAAAD